MVADPTAELPPKISADEGLRPEMGPSLKKGKGVLRPIPSAMIPVR